MDDFSPLKFINTSTPIRSIQAVRRDEERNRKKREQEEEKRRAEEDVIELQKSVSADTSPSSLSPSGGQTVSHEADEFTGEHIDVRI